jgi:hypothetical protein
MSKSIFAEEVTGALNGNQIKIETQVNQEIENGLISVNFATKNGTTSID